MTSDEIISIMQKAGCFDIQEGLEITEYQYQSIIMPYIEWQSKQKLMNQENSLYAFVVNDEITDEVVIRIDGHNNKLYIPSKLKSIAFIYGSTILKSEITIQDIKSIWLDTTTLIMITDKMKNNTIRINEESCKILERLLIDEIDKILKAFEGSAPFIAETDFISRAPVLLNYHRKLKGIQNLEFNELKDTLVNLDIIANEDAKNIKNLKNLVLKHINIK